MSYRYTKWTQIYVISGVHLLSVFWFIAVKDLNVLSGIFQSQVWEEGDFVFDPGDENKISLFDDICYIALLFGVI